MNNGKDQFIFPNGISSEEKLGQATVTLTVIEKALKNDPSITEENVHLLMGFLRRELTQEYIMKENLLELLPKIQDTFDQYPEVIEIIRRLFE